MIEFSETILSHLDFCLLRLTVFHYPVFRMLMHSSSSNLLILVLITSNIFSISVIELFSSDGFLSKLKFSLKSLTLKSAEHLCDHHVELYQVACLPPFHFPEVLSCSSGEYLSHFGFVSMN